MSVNQHLSLSGRKPAHLLYRGDEQNIAGTRVSHRHCTYCRKHGGDPRKLVHCSTVKKLTLLTKIHENIIFLLSKYKIWYLSLLLLNSVFEIMNVNERKLAFILNLSQTGALTLDLHCRNLYFQWTFSRSRLSFRIVTSCAWVDLWLLLTFETYKTSSKYILSDGEL